MLHSTDYKRSREFYAEKLGFTLLSSEGAVPETEPQYMAFEREGVEIHVSSFPGDGVAGAATMLVVSDVDVLYEEFAATGIEIDVPPVDQTWGTREMYVRDPDRNCLRFVSGLASG